MLLISCPPCVTLFFILINPSATLPLVPFILIYLSPLSSSCFLSSYGKIKFTHTTQKIPKTKLFLPRVHFLLKLVKPSLPPTLIMTA